VAFKKIILVFIIIISVGCAQKNQWSNNNTSSQLKVEQVQKLYEQAMLRFWDKYDKSLEKVFSPYKSVWKGMGWAKVKKDSNIVSLTGGSPIAFFSVYDPEHKSLEKWFPTLTTLTTNRYPMVMIRPDPISQQWIPIFILHEMSHIVVSLNKMSIASEDNEFAAYSLEKLALNSVTNFNYDQLLEELLLKIKVEDETQLLNRMAEDLKSKKGEFFTDLIQLDKKISLEAPLSHSEKEMRLGTHAISLGLMSISKESIPVSVQRRRQTQFVKSFLKVFGRK